MAEKSGFFDSHLVDGEYDRVYLAESFAKYFASFVGNGIFGGKSNELMVQQKSTADMSVRVLSGQAFINGYWYENDDEISLSIDAADGVLNRIDLIVVRWDNSERVIRLAVKKGVSATKEVAPQLQRDADFYELKLAQISIKAGTTKITQANISDTRYLVDVCGLVMAVVQQLDGEEFGIQLATYIEEFIAEHEELKQETSDYIENWKQQTEAAYNTWFSNFSTNSTTAVNNLINSKRTEIDKIISDTNAKLVEIENDINALLTSGRKDIDSLISLKTTEIDNLISESRNRFNTVIAELEEIAAANDIASLVQDINDLEANVQTLSNKINNLFRESGPNAGCYYRIASTGENEWINPPNEIGITYRTTERWNGKPVYQRIFYIGALPNKTYMYFNVDARFDRIISISGFAVDSDNNLNYPFPIIINGLTPVAVISSAEGDGGEGSGITIQTNEDLSSFVGYITVKYVKE